MGGQFSGGLIIALQDSVGWAIRDHDIRIHHMFVRPIIQHYRMRSHTHPLAIWSSAWWNMCTRVSTVFTFKHDEFVLLPNVLCT
eukprot:12342655-Alexandrium_andersonii.AAC.1